MCKGSGREGGRGREYRELGERRVEIHSNEFVFVLQAAHVSVDVREGVRECVCVPVLSLCLYVCVCMAVHVLCLCKYVRVRANFLPVCVCTRVFPCVRVCCICF